MAQASAPTDDWRAAVWSSWLEARRHSLSSNGTADGIDDKDGDDGDDARFRRCWRRQGCKTCLGISACSWCPFSAVCVPNDHLIPALAPAFDGDLVCPHWAERWELRTRPLGCQVSTITSLAALVAGSGTLVAALLLWLLVLGVRRLQRRWRRVSPVAWFRRLRGRRRRRSEPAQPEDAETPESPEAPEAPEAPEPPQEPEPPAAPRNEQTPLLSDVQ